MATTATAPLSHKTQLLGIRERALRIVGRLLLASTIALSSSALGQTNVDPDVLPASGYHNLSPVVKALPRILWSFGAILVIIAAVVTLLRRRVNPSLYATAVDAQWQDDALTEAGATVDEGEVIEALDDFGKEAQADDGAATSATGAAGANHGRIYTPATGPAWTEAKLNAFLSACLKANCLGQAWREEAARRRPGQQVSRRPPDPREAELIRKFKARWQEFHVEPEFGIFVEHVGGGTGSERSRVCLIEVAREKHAVARAALNAGFVIESLGRYLKSSDLVYPGELGYYHAPMPEELTALSDEEKKRLLRLQNIPDPWRAMIGCRGVVRHF